MRMKVKHLIKGKRGQRIHRALLVFIIQLVANDLQRASRACFAVYALFVMVGSFEERSRYF